MTMTQPASHFPLLSRSPGSVSLSLVLRVAMYLRQSQDRYGDELAITRQREDCLALCRSLGWPSPVAYVDNDCSASTGKRSAYQRLLRDIRDGKIDAVVVWDLDRLHRRPIELEEFITLADVKQLKLATVTGECDLSTDNGRLFARIKGAVARAEVERKSARQKREAIQHAEHGKPWWCIRPFGFTADPGPDGKWSSRNEIRLHPVEAPMVAAAYEAVLAGTPLYTIAQQWTSVGVMRPRGGPWRGGQVRVLLLSARNAGLREHYGQVVGVANWPPIVTEEQYRGVVALLSDRKRGGRAPGGRKRLLTGIAAGECGHKLGGGVTKSSGTLTYLCKSCGRVSRAAEQVDAMVISAVVERLARPDASDLVADRTLDGIDDLIAQRRSLREQQKALGIKHANGEVSLAFAESADQGFTEKINNLSARIDDAPTAEIFDGLIGVDDVDAAFDALNLGRQRAVVNALVKVVVKRAGAGRGRHKVSRDDIDIDFRR